MKIRVYKTIRAIVILNVLFSLFFTPLIFAAGQRTLFLTNEPGLEKPAVDMLKNVVEIQPTGIETDYRSRVFITDEGTKIPFSQLIHRKSLKSSPVLKKLSDEYQADTLVLMWVAGEKTEEYAAYDVKKHIVTLRIRIVDVASGRNIVDRPVTYESSFEQRVNRHQLLARAVDKTGTASIKSDLDNHYAAASGTGHVKIVIRNIDQKDYFDKRDDFLALVKEAGIQGTLRDTYDRPEKTFTIRSELYEDIEAYYRSLYARATALQTFDSFEIDKSGRTINITRLPPERKRLIISGLTPDRYHDRLKIYRDALTSQKAIRDVVFKYISESSTTSSKLVFSFTCSEDLTKLEEGIWNSLSSVGEAPNRRLVSIADRIIHIRSGIKEGDRVAMTVHFNNVAPGDYRKIGAALDKIIKDLSVRNLGKAYDPDEYRLTYNFDVNMSPVNMDTVLWGNIEQDKTLDHIAQDTTFGNTLSYFYLRQLPDTVSILMSVKNLSPQDYKHAGRRIVQVIKSIDGITELKHTYSEYDQTLRIIFKFNGKDAYPIDDVVWKAVKKDRKLKKLAAGTISDSELEYFFSGDKDSRASDVVLIMRKVSGQGYKVVSTAFSKLLGSIEDVRDVRYAYVFPKRTVEFRINYEGKSLFKLEDALQKKMIKNKLFRYVAKGPSSAGRLVYFYYSKPFFVVDTGPDEKNIKAEPGIPSADSSGLTDLIKTLDPSVVTIVAKSARSEISHGSGFFVSPEGYILTAAHVVIDGRLMVKAYDGRFYEAQLIKLDRELDIALIKVVSSIKGFPEVRIADSSRVEKGNSILVIGTPITREYEHTSETGIVSGIDRHRGLIQLSVPVYPGHSGSPVFDSQGDVIGIVIMVPMAVKTQFVSGKGEPSVQKSIQAVESMGLAVPINYARGLLQMIK
ncbi:MAG: serine protease [Bacteroidota bacterium]|nr:serine protease [Bacteroidota bacterium]